MRGLWSAALILCFSSEAFCKPKESPLKNCRTAQYSERAELEQFVKKNPKAQKAAEVLFCLGELNRKQFQKKGDKAALKEALSSYEKVARRFSGTELAATSLISLGDLRRSGLKDEVAARAAYFEVIDRYPRHAPQAKKRLEPKAPKDKEASAKPREENVVETPIVKIEPTSIVVEAPVVEAKATPPAPISKKELSPAATPTAEPLPTASQVTPKPGTGTELLLDESSIPKRPLIVIDPGHGGEDQGAKGVDGILEKNVVLEISKELDELLKERLRARTFLTRSTDVFIPLADRTRLANDRNADLFVSVHANASEYKTAQGIETYYLDNTKEKSSLKLADRENASLNFGKKENSDLSFIFSDLIQNMKLDDSISLAHQLQDSMTLTLSRYYQGINNLGVKKAPFYVLVGAHMPCVLVEVSFIDHPLEGRRLSEPRYQKLIAQSLYEGIRKYFIKREKPA